MAVYSQPLMTFVHSAVICQQPKTFQQKVPFLSKFWRTAHIRYNHSPKHLSIASPAYYFHIRTDFLLLSHSKYTYFNQKSRGKESRNPIAVYVSLLPWTHLPNLSTQLHSLITLQGHCETKQDRDWPPTDNVCDSAGTKLPFAEAWIYIWFTC